MEHCREKFIGKNRRTTGFFVDEGILEKAETEDYQVLEMENLKISYSPVKHDEMSSPVVDFWSESGRKGKGIEVLKFDNNKK